MTLQQWNDMRSHVMIQEPFSTIAFCCHAGNGLRSNGPSTSGLKTPKHSSTDRNQSKQHENRTCTF